MDQRRLGLTLAALLLAAFVYDGVVRSFLEPVLVLPSIPGGLPVLTTILTLFSLTHASVLLGWRHAAAFFVISAAVSWAFEQIGVETGAVYGEYHYTDVLGPKLGHVPVLIPMAWFMMIYPSYVIANLIRDGRPAGTPPGAAAIALLALLGALVMTAWDLVVDPILSGSAVRAWVWEEGGPYFGIPVQNFVGWIATTFSVYLAYRFLERTNPPTTPDAVPKLVAAMPLMAYGAMLASNLQAPAAPDELAVIGPMVMGLPLVAAISRLQAQPAR